MPRYVANAIKGGSSSIEASIAHRAGGAGSLLSRAVLAPLGVLKSTVQGAGAGALTFLGAMRLSSGAAAEPAPMTLTSIADKIMQGGAPGTMELIGAAALFLTAGKGPARVVGLIGVVALVTVYANGAAPAEVMTYVENLYAKLSGFLIQFAPGAVSAG